MDENRLNRLRQYVQLLASASGPQGLVVDGAIVAAVEPLVAGGYEVVRKIRLVDLQTVIVDYGDTHWRLLVRDQYAHVSRRVFADYLHVEDAGTAEVTFECFAFDDGLDVTPRAVLAAMNENGRTRPNRADAETYLDAIADIMAHDDEGMSLRNLLADTTGIVALCGKVFDQGELQSAVAIDQTAEGVREIVILALDDVAPWQGRCFLRVRSRRTSV